jgi:hypothetical protein
MREERLRPARALTRGPNSHWFGYYDKFPWDLTGRYLVCLEVDFPCTRPPRPDDAATIGLIDTAKDNAWTPLARTHAWCWQQGCMLHWLPTAPDREIVYNARSERGDRFVSAIRNVFTGETRTLPRPVYAISPDGRLSVSPNFSRLGRLRPGYGYVGVPEPERDDPHPANDGIWVMDMATGDHTLIIPYDQVAHLRRDKTMENTGHWFNHLQFNTDGTRFVWLHRWKKPDGSWHTRMLTARPDGSDIHIVADHEMVSHFDWRDPKHILAWARHNCFGDHFYLYTDQSIEMEAVGADDLTQDGHCTYSPDRRWFISDTYPDRERIRRLMLYNPAEKRLLVIGKYREPPEFQGEWRVDLHGRWSRDGRRICFDAAHEGQRQLYVTDVADIVGG